MIISGVMSPSLSQIIADPAIPWAYFVSSNDGARFSLRGSCAPPPHNIWAALIFSSFKRSRYNFSFNFYLLGPLRAHFAKLRNPRGLAPNGELFAERNTGKKSLRVLLRTQPIYTLHRSKFYAKVHR